MTPFVCTTTLSGSVTIAAAGTCSLTVAQSGNATYSAAPNVPQSFTVNKAPLTVTANNLSMALNATVPVLMATVTGLVNGNTFSGIFTCRKDLQR
jgi:hypothetical protein